MVKIAGVTEILESKGFKLDYSDNGLWKNSPVYRRLYEFFKCNYPANLQLFLDLPSPHLHFPVNSIKIKTLISSVRKIVKSQEDLDIVKYLENWYRTLRQEHVGKIYFTMDVKKLRNVYVLQEKRIQNHFSLLMWKILEVIIKNSESPEIQKLLKTITQWDARHSGTKLLQKEVLHIDSSTGKIGEFPSRTSKTEPVTLYTFKSDLTLLLLNPGKALELFTYYTLAETKKFELINNLKLIKDNKEVGEIDLVINNELVCVISTNLSSESEKKQMQFLAELGVPFITIGAKKPQIGESWNTYHGHFDYQEEKFPEKLIENISSRVLLAEDSKSSNSN